eukprot:4099398-Amphidinium_carterae.1
MSQTLGVERMPRLYEMFSLQLPTLPRLVVSSLNYADSLLAKAHVPGSAENQVGGKALGVQQLSKLSVLGVWGGGNKCT